MVARAYRVAQYASSEECAASETKSVEAEPRIHDGCFTAALQAAEGTSERSKYTGRPRSRARRTSASAPFEAPGRRSYAQAPKDQVDQWTKLVFDYLKGRVTLKRVYVLIDARHGIKKNDEDVLTLLDKAAVSYQIVLTKTDKIKAAGVPRLIEETLLKIKKRPAAFPGVLATSSEKVDGLEDLRAAIVLVANGG